MVPAGYRVALTIRGKDYEYEGDDFVPSPTAYPQNGVGPFTHTNPADRPPEVFGGRNRLHFGADRAPYVLLPIIPSK